MPLISSLSVDKSSGTVNSPTSKPKVRPRFSWASCQALKSALSTQRCSDANLLVSESLIVHLTLITRKLRLKLLDLGLERIVLVHLAAQEPSR